MGKIWSVLLTLVICLSAGVQVAADEGAKHAAATGRAYRYARWNPSAFYLGGEDSIRLEVRVNGPVRAVTVSYNPDRAFNDDGIDGDRVAGDDIWTWSGFSYESAKLDYPNHDTSQIYFDIQHSDGSWERAILSPAFGMVARKREKIVQVAANIFATKRAVFIVDKTGSLFTGTVPSTGINMAATVKQFYTVYPDLFDLVCVMPVCTVFDPASGYELTPSLGRVRNRIQNIGMALFTNSDTYGSKDKLVATIYHGFGNGEILDHEVGHIWGLFLGNNLGFSNNGHYNAWTNQECQMSSFPYLALSRNADGTWKAVKISSGADDLTVGYSPLTLYAMGLIPPENVPPVMILKNPSWPDLNHIPDNQFTHIGIDEIMDANGGERKPSWPNAPKTLRMALIVVTDHNPTPAEADFFSDVVRYYTSKSAAVGYLVPFRAATGGRATMKGKLPKLK